MAGRALSCLVGDIFVHDADTSDLDCQCKVSSSKRQIRGWKLSPYLVVEYPISCLRVFDVFSEDLNVDRCRLMLAFVELTFHWSKNSKKFFNEFKGLRYEQWRVSPKKNDFFYEISVTQGYRSTVVCERLGIHPAWRNLLPSCAVKSCLPCEIPPVEHVAAKGTAMLIIFWIDPFLRVRDSVWPCNTLEKNLFQISTQNWKWELFGGSHTVWRSKSIFVLPLLSNGCGQVLVCQAQFDIL